MIIQCEILDIPMGSTSGLFWKDFSQKDLTGRYKFRNALLFIEIYHRVLFGLFRVKEWRCESDFRFVEEETFTCGGTYQKQRRK